MHMQYRGGSDANSSESRSADGARRDASTLHQHANSAGLRERFSAIRFLIITIGGIGLAEVAAMFVVYFFRQLSYSLQILLDAGIMLVLIYPLVYLFSLKPLLRHIEERQRAEDALRQSEQRFAKAFQMSPAALSISRLADGGFIDVNETFLQAFGFSREEVISRTSIELDLYSDPDSRSKLLRRLSEDGRAREFETNLKTKSGDIRNVLLSTEAIELGGESCILATLSDITERKRSEEQLGRVNRALKMIND